MTSLRLVDFAFAKLGSDEPVDNLGCKKRWVKPKCISITMLGVSLSVNAFLLKAIYDNCKLFLAMC